MTTPKYDFAPGTAGRIFSTTDGRQRFPDLLQTTYGEKAVIGFDRYGRALGAVVPMEAVLMLAGDADRVDDGTRERIKRAAEALMAKINPESGRVYSIEEIDAQRRGSEEAAKAYRSKD